MDNTTYKFHITLLEAKEITQNSKEEDLKVDSSQDFSISTSTLQTIPGTSSVFEEIPELKKGKEYLGIGAYVSPNVLRGYPSTPEHPIHVPILLDYGKQSIQIDLTIKGDNSETKVVSKTVSYELTPDYFPRPPLNSKWKQLKSVNETTNLLTVDKEELIKEETWNKYAPEIHYICFSEDYQIMLDLGIVRVLNQDLEPLLVYIDRIYALSNIKIYVNKDLLSTC